MYCLRKSVTLISLYGTMYLDLDYHPPYYDKKSAIFETHINRNLICIHGYTNCVAHNDLITWVSKKLGNVTFWISTSWEIIPCPRTIIWNNCKENNLLGDILNASNKVDDQEYYGFTGLFLKIGPTVIDEYTKK